MKRTRKYRRNISKIKNYGTLKRTEKRDCAMKQKKGLHFILASIFIWSAVLVIHLLDINIAAKNLFTSARTGNYRENQHCEATSEKGEEDTDLVFNPHVWIKEIGKTQCANIVPASMFDALVMTCFM